MPSPQARIQVYANEPSRTIGHVGLVNVSFSAARNSVSEGMGLC